MDLPPELVLQIFSWFSVRDLCQCVNPEFMKWSILTKHPFLLQELSFSHKEILTPNVCKLLCGSPLICKLILKVRHDNDAILQQVCKSNQLSIKTL
jgi:hypothetical protein